MIDDPLRPVSEHVQDIGDLHGRLQRTQGHAAKLKKEIEENLRGMAAEMLAMEERKTALKAELETLEERLKLKKSEIAAALTAANMHKFRTDTHTIFCTAQWYIRALPEQKANLFAWLRENNLGTLIKEDVNANSLQSALREVIQQSDDSGVDMQIVIPEDLAPLVNVYEESTVAKRALPKKKGAKNDGE
jgi:DNA repair exonuclease SbcCD ATPase subunit